MVRAAKQLAYLKKKLAKRNGTIITTATNISSRAEGQRSSETTDSLYVNFGDANITAIQFKSLADRNLTEKFLNHLHQLTDLFRSFMTRHNEQRDSSLSFDSVYSSSTDHSLEPIEEEDEEKTVAESQLTQSTKSTAWVEEMTGSLVYICKPEFIHDKCPYCLKSSKVDHIHMSNDCQMFVNPFDQIPPLPAQPVTCTTCNSLGQLFRCSETCQTLYCSARCQIRDRISHKWQCTSEATATATAIADEPLEW